MGGTAEGSEVSQSTHPDAPATDSGRAYFRDANSFLDDDNPAGTLRHARSPAGRFLLAQASIVPVNAGAGVKPQKKNPPPKTKPLNEELVRTNNALVDFNIRVIILTDRKSASNVPARSARTRLSPSGGVKQYQGMSLKIRDDKVMGLSRKLVIHGAYTIRTEYGRKAKATQDSLYGRGTTVVDKTKGDVSLGFHEWCHQREYLQYLRTTPFPTFTGKLGMSQKDFVAATEQFNSAYEKFRDGLNALGDAVDEVGYTKSQCQADGKCR